MRGKAAFYCSFLAFFVVLTRAIGKQNILCQQWIDKVGKKIKENNQKNQFSCPKTIAKRKLLSKDTYDKIIALRHLIKKAKSLRTGEKKRYQGVKNFIMREGVDVLSYLLEQPDVPAKGKCIDLIWKEKWYNIKKKRCYTKQCVSDPKSRCEGECYCHEYIGFRDSCKCFKKIYMNLTSDETKQFEQYEVAYNVSRPNRNYGIEFNDLVRAVCQKSFPVGNDNFLQVLKEQNNCVKTILEGTKALEQFFQPILKKLDAVAPSQPVIDLFEGSEFTFAGAHFCVAKKERTEDSFNLKCCYKFSNNHAHHVDNVNLLAGRRAPTHSPRKAVRRAPSFHLVTQSKMTPSEKMGDSYGPHSWCGDEYNKYVDLKYFKRKYQKNHLPSDQRLCTKWIKENKLLGDEWVKKLEKSTKCPSKITLNFKQVIEDREVYLGPVESILKGYCKNHEGDKSFRCLAVDSKYISDQYHPGSDFCFRVHSGNHYAKFKVNTVSKKGRKKFLKKILKKMSTFLGKLFSKSSFFSAIKANKVATGNQCCYGHLNQNELDQGVYRLIVAGTAAGTVDKGKDIPNMHQYLDVSPVGVCGVAEYLKYRPPFQGDNQGVLESPPMLSEKNILYLHEHAFTVPRTMMLKSSDEKMQD